MGAEKHAPQKKDWSAGVVRGASASADSALWGAAYFGAPRSLRTAMSKVMATLPVMRIGDVDCHIAVAEKMILLILLVNGDTTEGALLIIAEVQKGAACQAIKPQRLYDSSAIVQLQPEGYHVTLYGSM